MNINFFDINDSNKPSIVVIYAKYKGKIVMCRHEKRETWEIPGGHIEENETPEEAARREIYEETGAIKCELSPICKYSFEINKKTTFSIMYNGIITEMGDLPNYEIEEIKLFDELPENITYPEVYKKIFGSDNKNVKI